jgi:hypothetical protein
MEVEIAVNLITTVSDPGSSENAIPGLATVLELFSFDTTKHKCVITQETTLLQDPPQPGSSDWDHPLLAALRILRNDTDDAGNVPNPVEPLTRPVRSN